MDDRDEFDGFSDVDDDVASSSGDELDLFNAGERFNEKQRVVSFVPSSANHIEETQTHPDKSSDDDEEEYNLTKKKRNEKRKAFRDEEDEDFGAFGDAGDADDFRPSFVNSAGQTGGGNVMKFQYAGVSKVEDDDQRITGGLGLRSHANGSNPTIDVDEFGRDIQKSDVKSVKDLENHKMKAMLKEKLQRQSKREIPSQIQRSSSPLVGFGGMANRQPSPSPNVKRDGEGKSGFGLGNSQQNQVDIESFKSVGISKMALKYFLKNSATGRLGKNEQGISAPIEVMTRPERAGLGMVEEASSLPANRANTEHLERIRLEAEAREQKERDWIREQQNLEKIWRQPGFAESDSYYANPDLVRVSRKDDIGDALVAEVERDLMVARERLKTVQRTVAATEQETRVRQQHSRQVTDEARELSRRKERLDHLILVLEDLMDDSGWSQPSTVKRILERLQIDFTEQEWSDFELERIAPLLAAYAVDELFDSNQDLALDLVKAILSVTGTSSVVSTVLRKVVPKLNKFAENYQLGQSRPLHLEYFPWLDLIFLSPASREAILEAILEAPIKILERELTRSWTNIEDIEALIQLLKPWKDVCGGDPFVQELVARGLGAKLFKKGNLVLAKHYLDHNLLSLDDFGCVCEGQLQKMVRDDSSPFVIALKEMKVASAARMYSDVKSVFPVESLMDNCCRGRIRHIFQYALEMIKVTMANGTLSDVDTAILNAIEPSPKTFAEAWYRNKVETLKPVEIAADYTSAATLQATVESLAETRSKSLVPHPQDKRVDGKRVYNLGRINCYFDRGVVYASTSLRDWRAVSVDKLFQLS